MKKIDYAIDNLPEYWSMLDTKEKIKKYLCPMDFGLSGIEECHYSEVHFEPCEKCWNEDIRGDK